MERKGGLEGGRDVAEECEAAEDVGLSEGVGEVVEGYLKEIGGDKGSFASGGRIVGVELNEADEDLATRGKGILPDDIFGEELQDDCFEGRDGLLAGRCGHEVTKGGGM